MCNPVALQFGAALVMGASAYNQAQSQSQMLENNAAVLHQKTDEAKRLGALAYDRKMTEMEQAIGAQRAAMAGSGSVLDTGTNSKILGDTVTSGTLDALTVQSNALKQAWGYQMDANAADFQAGATRTAGTLGAVGTLIGGIGQAWGMSQTAGSNVGNLSGTKLLNAYKNGNIQIPLYGK